MVINGNDYSTVLLALPRSICHTAEKVQSQACKLESAECPKWRLFVSAAVRAMFRALGTRNVVVVLNISSNGSLFLIPWAGKPGHPDIACHSPSLASPSLRLVSFHIVSVYSLLSSLLPPSLQNRSPLFRAWRMATTSPWRMTAELLATECYLLFSFTIHCLGQQHGMLVRAGNAILL